MVKRTEAIKEEEGMRAINNGAGSSAGQGEWLECNERYNDGWDVMVGRRHDGRRPVRVGCPISDLRVQSRDLIEWSSWSVAVAHQSEAGPICATVPVPYIRLRRPHPIGGTVWPLLSCFTGHQPLSYHLSTSYHKRLITTCCCV